MFERDRNFHRQVAIDFRLPIQSAQDTDLTRFEETTIEAVVELQYEIGGKQEVYTSPPITMTIASDLALEVRDAVEETDDGKERHLMKWVLTNSFHDLERVEVSTDIYGPVAVDADAAVVSAGEIQFDEKTKRLVWRMETLPRTLDVVALEIPIILNEKNPTQTNVTSQIELRAFDPVSGVEILRVGDGIQLVHEEN